MREAAIKSVADGIHDRRDHLAHARVLGRRLDEPEDGWDKELREAWRAEVTEVARESLATAVRSFGRTLPPPPQEKLPDWFVGADELLPKRPPWTPPANPLELVRDACNASDRASCALDLLARHPH